MGFFKNRKGNCFVHLPDSARKQQLNRSLRHVSGTYLNSHRLVSTLFLCILESAPGSANQGGEYGGCAEKNFERRKAGWGFGWEGGEKKN